ncbi:hypothetical protein KIN20_015308 [Parelaphostrongylus tenuis]|uniref:Uncharacterized protein n=1 Tax=Parelaphostrongylus tenuis TaxID=148309 RepID=A0AAD5MEP3_PARTN|nr:hypothetical protein KIN20_015308 [Parelaphostrongylus tenuis]
MVSGNIVSNTVTGICPAMPIGGGEGLRHVGWLRQLLTAGTCSSQELSGYRRITEAFCKSKKYVSTECLSWRGHNRTALTSLIANVVELNRKHWMKDTVDERAGCTLTCQAVMNDLFLHIGFDTRLFEPSSHWYWCTTRIRKRFGVEGYTLVCEARSVSVLPCGLRPCFEEHRET